MREVVETVGFAGKLEDCREAGFRLANHRLQPLRHLTVARNLSIRHDSSCEHPKIVAIVPGIVPASFENRVWTSVESPLRHVGGNAAVFFGGAFSAGRSVTGTSALELPSTSSDRTVVAAP
jgi:hypothetical protein